MFFLGTETPRPSRELLVVVGAVVADEVDGWAGSSLVVFMERFNGASSDPVDVLGLPMSELTSNATGLPFTVWLLAFVPLLTLLLLLLFDADAVLLVVPVPGRRSN